MEIKSFKANSSLDASKKDAQQPQDTNDAATHTADTIISSKKKLLVQKPPTDDGKAKSVRVKARGQMETKNSNNKRPAPSVQEPQSQSKPDSLNEFRVDDEAAKRQELEDMIEAMDPNYENKRKALQDVEFIFDPKLRDSNMPYHQEGNTEFYTKENEKKREALKSDPSVIRALDDIISLYQFESDGTLHKEGYSKIHSQIAKSMRKDLKEKALGRLVEQDWKYDSKEKGYMTKKELFDALFELGDVWTPEINVHQYVAFFQQLRKKLKGREESSRPGETGKENPYNILH